ncbi:MAG TPA: molecular chaperone DnaK, partial [Bacteroidia bacterium]|nr:molecular chaperone DnaK [Bacteroidia bacterium]
TEKQLKEFGDKLPADKKQPIEDGLAELKKAHEARDIAGIETSMAKLQTVLQGMYEAMQNQAGGSSENPNANANPQNDGKDSTVTDVDYEEVKDDKK